MLYKDTFNSPLGQIVLLSNDKYLLGLWFSDQKHFGANYDLDQAKEQHVRPINLAKTWLKKYFAGNNPNIDTVPLNPKVTVFRQKVLAVLTTVPLGSVITYKEIAAQLPEKSSARAVGGAVGHNPISIIIPCHRVVGTNGSLTGYAGGIKRKISLLTLEGFDQDNLVHDHI